MRYHTFLVMWAALCAANDVIHAPLNIRLRNSAIPRSMADALLEGSDTSLLTLNPEARFNRFFVHQNNESVEYICSIPHQDTTSLDLDEQGLLEEDDATILKTAVDLIHLSFTRARCVWAYDLRGFYWTYGYCHGDKIIQYHETAPIQDRPHRHVPGAPDMVYVLGRFTKASISELQFENQASQQLYANYLRESERTFQLLDEKLLPFSHHPAQKVVVQIITDGSMCDMTLQPRSVEIVYKCDASGGNQVRILDVTEIKTCHYKLFVHVPKLCEYEQFAPNKNLHDLLVPVTCQQVSDDVDGAGTFEDFDHEMLRKNSPFPVPATNRINIAEHSMIALSRGFYLAKRRTDYRTLSEYYNMRNVILFNGFYESLLDLNLRLGRVVYNSIGKNFLAPRFELGQQVMLAWLHLFIVWLEVYNFKGEFLGLARILNDGSSGKKTLVAQMFDPVSLLDIDGEDTLPDSFSRPNYEAPYNMWNFEMFSASGESLKLLRRKRKSDSRLKTEPMVLNNNDGLEGILPEAVDSNERLMKGNLNEERDYVFEFVAEEGLTETFTVSIIPNLEYLEFPEAYDENSPSTKDTVSEVTVTVTETVTEGTKKNIEMVTDEKEDGTEKNTEAVHEMASHDEL